MSERHVDLQQPSAAAGKSKTRSGLYLDPHQSRTAEPTQRENAIGDVIERCYAAGVVTCDPIVAELNKAGIPAPDNATWTVASFQAEMMRLGA